MTDAEKKNAILMILNWELKEAQRRYVDSVALHASVKVKKEMFDESEEFTGGMGMSNPHDENLKRCQVGMEGNKKAVERQQELVDYATNIFILK